jgi:endonuclease YncB( thermonuclease family)
LTNEPTHLASPTPGVSTAKPRLVIGPAQPTRVIDADTLKFSLPMHAIFPDIKSDGFEPTVRVAHVNAAELGTVEGDSARAAVLGWVSNSDHSVGTLLVYGRDKFGRLLADYRTNDGGVLSEMVMALVGTEPMGVHDLEHMLLTEAAA